MASQHMHSIQIWDAKGSPPAGNFINILWREFVTPESVNSISIPELIEENADKLRNRYLAWVYELGERQFDGRRLIDHLEIRPGFSFWWMTLLAEKSNFAKSQQITDAIRLLAFDEWSRNFSSIKSLKLVSANQALHKCLRKWCKSKNISFEAQRLPSEIESKDVIKRIINWLPHTIQAGLWLLKYLIERWPLRGVGLYKWKNAVSRSTFISYFFNLNPQSAKQGRFESLYWTTLPSTLNDQRVNSSWLHIYVKNSVVPTAMSARKLISKFNASHREHQAHVFLDSFLGFRTILRAIRDFINVQRLGRVYFKKVFQAKPENSLSIQAILECLFEEDWKRSFFGVNAISNLLSFNLFERAFLSLPVQNNGVYLQENMGWEFGMIHAWRAANNENLVGFPHATVRFWDLRYFFDPRTYFRDSARSPMPDFVAVSGDLVKNAYLEGGYPAENLIEVEALRYLHLEKIDNKGLVPHSSFRKPRQILVLGDYLFSNTSKQLNLLQEISDKLKNIELTIKPHPVCHIDVGDFPKLKFKITNAPLSDLLERFDIAYTSSVTSSAVDAYSAGLQVISFLDPTTLNLSPLRGVAGVRFVSSAEMLRDALFTVPSRKSSIHDRVNYFNIDSSLPRWQALIKGSFK